MPGCSSKVSSAAPVSHSPEKHPCHSHARNPPTLIFRKKSILQCCFRACSTARRSAKLRGTGVALTKTERRSHMPLPYLDLAVLAIMCDMAAVHRALGRVSSVDEDGCENGRLQISGAWSWSGMRDGHWPMECGDVWTRTRLNVSAPGSFLPCVIALLGTGALLPRTQLDTQRS